MTRKEREEALDVLTDMANALHLIPTTRQGKALKMVLQALQRQEQEPCVDVISRQAMQTELKNCEVVEARDEDDDLVGYYNADTVDSIVRNLPPATPAEKVGKWIPVKYPTGVEAFGIKEMTAVALKCSECGKEVDTRTVANAVNINAQILRTALDKIVELEKRIDELQAESEVKE